MSPPVPRINNFIESTSKPIIDLVSKIFITTSLILGVNRVPILGTTNMYCLVFSFIYTTLLNVLFVSVSILYFPNDLVWAFHTIIDMLQYSICCVLGFVLHKRLQNFYLNLNKFDKEIGVNATEFEIRKSVYNFLQLIVTLIVTFFFHFYNHSEICNYLCILQLIFAKLSNCFELHYYGHLFDLMIPRLEALDAYMRKSFSNNSKIENINSLYSELQNNKDLHPNMKNLMDIYNNIIIAYDYLNEAIKWQMLTLLISTFFLVLSLLFTIVKSLILGTGNHSFPSVTISFMVIQLFPLLIPCVFADRVQKEVYKIKDCLATKLYENTLDKLSRSTARTLLALMETRNLTFSLFYMFDIDISLPFKYMALILTYLIILLQFYKIISADTST